MINNAGTLLECGLNLTFNSVNGSIINNDGNITIKGIWNSAGMVTGSGIITNNGTFTTTGALPGDIINNGGV
ncbi:hypothetical protein ID47_05665 [Candidatus Paracaedibacter acanthamoebae]|uniref:Uncharacterized protein n=1 Tax=Candidatus Odyssella acanthamoebae TaxID=91604 RepID=A0A077B053_9PROT|nr:hypothetical protein ID47_05665 [Candidatus Paracaedibacter acanthamoebae]